MPALRRGYLAARTDFGGEPREIAATERGNDGVLALGTAFKSGESGLPTTPTILLQCSTTQEFST